MVTRKIIDETILVPIQGNLADMCRIYSLNPVAEFIWNCLDGKTLLKDIANMMQTVFDVDAETAGRDIQEFLTEMLNANLITE